VATTAYYCLAILLPKALVDQGAAVTLSFGLSTLLFMVTSRASYSPGSSWRSSGGDGRSPIVSPARFPGLALMALAHRTGDYATVAMSAEQSLPD